MLAQVDKYDTRFSVHCKLFAILILAWISNNAFGYVASKTYLVRIFCGHDIHLIGLVLQCFNFVTTEHFYFIFLFLLTFFPDINECLSNPCGSVSNMECVDMPGNYSCLCKGDYQGDHCNQSKYIFTYITRPFLFWQWRLFLQWIKN